MNKLNNILGIGLLGLTFMYGCAGQQKKPELPKTVLAEREAEKNLEQEVRADVSQTVGSPLDTPTTRVAQYAIADPKSKYLVTDYGKVISRTGVKIGNATYTVLIYDFNERITGHQDYLRIRATVTRGDQQQHFELTDKGFNGDCDAGSVEVTDLKGNFVEEKTFNTALGEVEDRGYFQLEYDQALRTLAQPYEKRRK